jgi:hypothetical protein
MERKNMMYSNFVEINGTGPAFGDAPQVEKYAGAKNVKFLVRKAEGELDGAGDDILITTQIATNAVDPTATFYLNSYDLLNKKLDAEDFSLECVYCELEIDSVTQTDNRSFDIAFTGNAFVTFPEITPDAVPAVAAEDPVIVITSDTAFTSESAVETLANWTITPGTSGLTLQSVEYVDANTANLNFTGTVVAGHLIIQADKECYGGDLRSLSIDCNTGTETYVTESPAPAGTITLTLAKEAVLGASADLEIEYTLGDAASVVAFSETGMEGSLDTYIHFDNAFFHAKETTVDEDGNCLIVSDSSLVPNSQYSFKYASTIVGDTAKYYVMALYES